MSAKAETYRYATAMGKAYIPYGQHPLTFLSQDEKEELNKIGYTGKNSAGEETNIETYLNSLGKGKFKVEVTKADNGDYLQEFLIVRIIGDITHKSPPK